MKCIPVFFLAPSPDGCIFTTYGTGAEAERTSFSAESSHDLSFQKPHSEHDSDRSWRDPEKTAFAKNVGFAVCLVAMAVCVAVGQPWKARIWRVAVRSISPNDNRDIQGTWHVVLVEDLGRPIPVKRGTQKVIFN